MRSGCSSPRRIRPSSAKWWSRRSAGPVPLPPVLAEAITRPRLALKLSSDYADLRALLRS